MLNVSNVCQGKEGIFNIACLKYMYFSLFFFIFIYNNHLFFSIFHSHSECSVLEIVNFKTKMRNFGCFPTVRGQEIHEQRQISQQPFAHQCLA